MIVHSSKNPIILNEIFGLNRDFFGVNRYKYKSLQNNKNTVVNKSELTEEEKIERNKIGEQIQEYVIKNLNKYASTNSFKNKYRDNITPKSILIEKTDEYIPFGLGNTAVYEIRLSYYDYGIDEEYLDKWKRKNPDKDLEDCPVYNNDWYFDLLDKGKELLKEANKKFNNKYKLEYDDSGKFPVIDFYMYGKI